MHKPEEHHPPGKDSTKKISKLIGNAAQYAGSAKMKKVYTWYQLENFWHSDSALVIFFEHDLLRSQDILLSEVLVSAGSCLRRTVEIHDKCFYIDGKDAFNWCFVKGLWRFVPYLCIGLYIGVLSNMCGTLLKAAIIELLHKDLSYKSFFAISRIS